MNFRSNYRLYSSTSSRLFWLKRSEFIINNMSNFYAVRSGHQPGIYHTWNDCLQQVNKYPGASHKKLKTLSEAETFIKHGTTFEIGSRNSHSHSQSDQIISSSSNNQNIMELSRPKQFTKYNIASDIHSNTANSLLRKRQQTSISTTTLHMSAKRGLDSFNPSSDVQLSSKKINKYISTSSDANNNNKNNNGECNSFIGNNGNKKSPVFRVNGEIKEFPLSDLQLPATEDALVLYTDGGCQDNRNVDTKTCAAGWGVVVLYVRKGQSELHAMTIVQLYGPVRVDTEDEFFMGAEKGSNNTAELTAIGEALIWLRDNAKGLCNGFSIPQTQQQPLPQQQQLLIENSSSSSSTSSATASAAVTAARSIPVYIRFDSEYAAKSVLGIYNGEKNAELIKYIRNLYKQVVYTTYDGPTTASAATAGGGSNSAVASDSSEGTSSGGTSGSTSSTKHQLYRVSFSHVKGHSNNRWNEVADQLASRGITGANCNAGRYAVKATAAATATTVAAIHNSPQQQKQKSVFPVSAASITAAAAAAGASNLKLICLGSDDDDDDNDGYDDYDDDDNGDD